MPTKFLLFSLLLLLLDANYLLAQYPVDGQGSRYPLVTSIDSTFLKQFNKDLSFRYFKQEKALDYRASLRDMAAANDPLALFLYAQTHDWYPYGAGQPKDAPIALEYYQKAARKKLARANEFLFYGYQYGFMTLAEDSKKARRYLRKSIKYGNAKAKGKGYKLLAGLYYPSEGKKKPRKAIACLEKSMLGNQDISAQQDFIALIYEEQNQMEKAIEYLLASASIGSRTKAARFLLEGKKMPLDIDRGLDCLFLAIEQMEQKYPGGVGFMGADNPLHYLNRLYHCNRMISKAQGKKYLSDYFICP